MNYSHYKSYYSPTWPPLTRLESKLLLFKSERHIFTIWLYRQYRDITKSSFLWRDKVCFLSICMNAFKLRDTVADRGHTFMSIANHITRFSRVNIERSIIFYIDISRLVITQIHQIWGWGLWKTCNGCSKTGQILPWFHTARFICKEKFSKSFEK